MSLGKVCKLEGRCVSMESSLGFEWILKWGVTAKNPSLEMSHSRDSPGAAGHRLKPQLSPYFSEVSTSCLNKVGLEKVDWIFTLWDLVTKSVILPRLLASLGKEPFSNSGGKKAKRFPMFSRH